MLPLYFCSTSTAHLLKKIDESEETLDKKKDKWQKKISQLESALEKTKDSLHEEKARCRHKLTNEELRRNKLEEEIHNLNKWILEVDKKRKEAESELQKARKKFINPKAAAYLRLQKLRTETQARREKEDKLISTSKDLCRTVKELEITKSLLKAPQETKRCMKNEWNSRNEH
jgi:hypothetical protein